MLQEGLKALGSRVLAGFGIVKNLGFSDWRMKGFWVQELLGLALLGSGCKGLITETVLSYKTCFNSISHFESIADCLQKLESCKNS